MMLGWEIYYTFFKIGIISFGGGYAMIPLMRVEFIDHRGWLSLKEFLDIMAVSEVTPGPISVNIATFTGFKVAGVGGSVLATLGVISPSIILLLIIYGVIRRYLQKENSRLQQWGGILLQGIRPAIIALIGIAALYLGEGAIQDLMTAAVFLGAFLLTLFARLNPVLIILIAGLFSLVVESYAGVV